MKIFLNSLLILVLLISGIKLQLTEEERQRLYKKVTKRINFGEIKKKFNPLIFCLYCILEEFVNIYKISAFPSYLSLQNDKFSLYSF